MTARSASTEITDYSIIAVAPTGMRMFNCATRETLATATATGCCGAYTWTVHADGVDDVTASSRAHAIGAMIDHAMASMDGNSTLVPHELIAQT